MDTGIALLFMQGHRCRRRRRKQTEREKEKEREREREREPVENIIRGYTAVSLTPRNKGMKGKRAEGEMGWRAFQRYAKRAFE